MRRRFDPLWARRRIERRLSNLIATWPPPLATDFRRRYGIAPRGDRRPAGFPPREAPYWIGLPSWLAGESLRTRGARRAASRVLDDILWGQYCLFLTLRMQDDLFDGQASSASLIYAADQTLVESMCAFSQHFPRASPFWPILYDALRTTTRAIVEVDAVQRDPRVLKGRLPEMYGDVAAVLNVGAAAACIRFRRSRDLPRVARVAHDIAMAAQILDDMQDVGEDLRRGRCNYAAGGLCTSRRAILRRLAEARRAGHEPVLGLDETWRLLDAVRGHLARAQRSIAPLGSTDADAYLRRHVRLLDRAREQLHRTQVRACLGHFLHRREPAVASRRARAPR